MVDRKPTDAIGTELRPGDLVLNDQGRVFVVQPTDPSIARQCLVTVDKARRLKGVWRRYYWPSEHHPSAGLICVANQTLTGDRLTNQRLYSKLYETMVAPRVRAELQARRDALVAHKQRIKEEQP